MARQNYAQLKLEPSHPSLHFKTVANGRFHSVRVGLYYRALGLPVPGVSAPFIGILECFGGLALLLGIGTRLVSMLLICDMIVAILASKLGGAQGLLTLGLPNGWTALRLELMLMLGALSLVLMGPGTPSLEKSVFKREIP